MEKIEYNGKKIRLISGYLDLEYRNIKDIADIKGLETLSGLEELNLCSNQIYEIKGLDKITNLKKLYLNNNLISEIKGLDCLPNLEELSLQYNNITEIKGLGSLKNLKMLYLEGNPIPKDFLEKLGGLSSKGGANNPQKFIDYCNQILVIGLEDVPIQGSMKDLHPIPFGMDTETLDQERSDLIEIEREKINTVFLSIQDLIDQNKFFEALNLLNGAKKIALNTELYEVLDDIIVKMHGIKLQRVRYHIDEALRVFSNSLKCSIQDINEFLSSVSPDFNFTEKKLKFKILARIRKLKLNAILDGNYIVFSQKLDPMHGIYPNQIQRDIPMNNKYESTVRMKKQCFNCGEKIDAESIICSYCGIPQDNFKY